MRTTVGHTVSGSQQPLSLTATSGTLEPRTINTDSQSFLFVQLFSIQLFNSIVPDLRTEHSSHVEPIYPVGLGRR